MTVSVMNPYRDTAKSYHRAGWFGPLILPYKMKEKPPSRFTGKRAEYPKAEEINEWINDGKSHNICIRLAGVDKQYEIIGIDVDHYMKGAKQKLGGDQLARLEQELGCPLPPTWTSTARTDGVSGIRFYRVPKELVFRGKVSEDIEVIQKRHRYAVVWPSIHPDGGTYWWYPPGVAPTKENRNVWSEKYNSEIPNARELELLPDTWVDYLSHNRIIMPEDGLIDMDTPVDEVYDWAEATFHGEESDKPCSKMREKLDKHLMKLANSTTLHDPLTNAHWNLLHLAFEGHQGWSEAIAEYETAWTQAVMDRGGTTMRDANLQEGEKFRSRTQCLRQIKAKSDERVELKAQPVDPSCLVTGACGAAAASLTSAGTGNEPPDELDDIPNGALKGIPDYEQNDNGNAKQFYDYFSTVESGPSVRWVKGYGWLVWHKGENPHWEVDPDGDQIIARMWHKVRDGQLNYVVALLADYVQKNGDFAKGLNGVTQDDVKFAKQTWMKYAKWAEVNGNVRNTENALKAVRSLPMVKKDINDLDSNPLLLGVANGVIELGRDNVRLRKAELSDYVTLNTNVAWERPSDHAKNIWQNYLDTFLPDPELQRCVQIAMGHCIMGGNPEKRIIVLKGDPNTGKSTMINAIEAALGDYSQSVGQSVFQNHKLNPVLARALSKRVIVCSEFDEKDQLSASQVKKLTGDTDTIQAELKGSNETVERVPDFVPILATNEVPGIKGADKALENRLHVLPFNIAPTRIDRGAANLVVRTCKTAVLSWLIDGYVEYRRVGELPTTKEMEEAKRTFVAELDEVATFAHECVEEATSPQQYVSRSVMYARFEQWWVENSFQQKDKPSMPKFTRRMQALGYKTRENKFRVSGKLDRWWMGVRLARENAKVIRMPKFNVPETLVQNDNSGTPENLI